MSESFKKCFGCKYSLRGHEGEFDCPECGITYDKDTQVWKSIAILGGPGTRKRGTIIVLVWLLFATIVMATYFLVDERIARRAVFFAFLISMSHRIWVSIKMRGIPPYVASTKKGLIYCHTGEAGNYGLMDWSAVHRFFHRSKTRYTTTEDLLMEIGAAVHINERTAFRTAVDMRIAAELKSS